MTVTANTTRNDYTAGSAQSEYDYTFQLNEAADVDVYLDGVKQTLNTHYVVQNVGNASGGTIVFTLEDENGDPIDPTQGAIINIVMAMDLDRDTNYQPSGAFLAADVNNDFDRLWLATNQQQTAVNRALRLKDTDVTTSSMELPLKDDRKGKLLAFNATTGDPEATTNNQSNWDTAYNNMITSASFTGGNYTLTQQDGGTISTSLDGRYLQLTGGTLTGTLSTSNIAVESGSSLTFANAAFAILSNGTESIIRETGSGDLSIEGENLYLRSTPTANYLSGTAGAEVKLYHNNSEKLSTTTTGISVTGNLDFGDNEEARFGDSADLKIYHNGTSSIIQDSGTGDLALLGTNLAFANGAGTSYYAAGTDGGAFTLYYNGSEKLATTSGGISVTGTITATGYNDSNWDTAYNNMITAVDYTGSTLTLTQQDGGTLTTTINGALGTSLVYDGSTKAEAVAAGLDVTGTVDADGLTLVGTAYIQSTTQPQLQVAYNSGNITGFYRSGGDFQIKNDNGAGTPESSIKLDEDGAVTLYHDNSSKLATTATGADVTGTLTADGLTVDTDTLYVDATNDRVGIGTSSPASLLHLESASAPTLKIDDSDSTYALELAQDGANGSMLLGSAGVLTIGVTNNSSSDTVAFQTKSTERMRIDASGNLLVGKTGIAINNVGVEARSNGTLLATKDGGTVAHFNRKTSDGTILDFRKDNTTVGSIGTASSGITFASGGSTERMRIDSSGNVGIGTSSPVQKLQVDGSIYSNGGEFFVNTGKGVSAVGDLVFKTHNGTAYQTTMHLDGADGNVGIGTTSPDYPLEVSKAGTSGVGSVGLVPDSDNGHYIRYGGTGTNNDVFRLLGVGNLERMRIDTSGNVGIGTTSPNDKFHVANGSTGAGYLRIANNEGYARLGTDGGNLLLDVGGSEKARIDSSGNVGIGTTSPNYELTVAGGGNNSIQIVSSTTGTGATNGLRFWNTGSSTAMWNYDNTPTLFGTNNTERLRIDSSGRVGIGTTSPAANLHVDASAPEFRLSQSGTAKVRLRTTGDNYINTGQNLGIGTTSPSTALDVNGTVTATAFAGDGSNLTGVLSDLVDDTTPQLGGALDANDKEIQNVNQIGIGFSGNVDYNIHVEDTKPLTNVEMVRIKNTSNTFGRVMTFYKSSNHHGSIGLSSVNFGQGVFVSSQQGGLKFQNQFSTVVVEPCGGDGADYDNAVDLGRSSNRFDDIYATNSTIQTSDRNLKQDIESLTDAEQRVAVAAKGLLRKFRWISAVEEKGDDARIHFGIMAQDLRDAFTAEGLDAGRYAMFTSTTWWEHEGENYYEADHAPEGATEVTRLGVRYSELLAFIISAI